MKDSTGLAAVALVAAVVPFLLFADDETKAWLDQVDTLLSPSAPKEAKRKAAASFDRYCRLEYGVWTGRYQMKYCQPEKWTDADFDRVEEGAMAAAKFNARESGGKSFEPWLVLGEACLVKGRYEEALDAYDRAIAFFRDYRPPKDDRDRDARKRGQDFAKCLYGRANALFALGRRKESTAARERGVVCRTIKRDGTGHSAATARFACGKEPVGCDYTMFLSATTDGQPARIRLSVNGHRFFEGDPKTGTNPFKPVMRKFRIPQKLLKKANVVKIENLTPGKDAETAEGCYRISYAVFRPDVADASGPEPEGEAGELNLGWSRSSKLKRAET